MEDKYMKKIRNCIQNVMEEKDDMFNNTNKIINILTIHITSLLEQNRSQSEKELVFKYITKTMALFSELNHSLLHFLEIELSLTVSESKKQPKCSNNMEKSSTSVGDILKNDCSFSNTIILQKSLENERYDQCVSSGIDNFVELLHAEKDILVLSEENESSELPSNSPFGRSQAVSTSENSQCCIVNNCDVEGIEKVRENLKIFGLKLDHNDCLITKSKGHLEELPCFKLNNQLDVPDKVLEELKPTYQVIGGECFEEAVSLGECEVLNNKMSQSQKSALKKKNSLDKDSNSENDIIGSSSSTSIFNNELGTIPKKLDCSPKQPSSKNTAIDKLTRLNEETKQGLQSSLEIQNIKFIPVENSVPIKNDLNYSSRKKRKSQKNKCINNSNGKYNLKHMEVPKKGTICNFSHIISPSEFYLQVVDEVSTKYLDIVTHALNNKLKLNITKYKSKNDAFLKLGKYCCAYVEQQKEWFRVQIINWKLECASDDIEVQAIDFGYKYSVPYNYLREMVKDVTEIPVLATKCHLALLYPPDSTTPNRVLTWPECTIECLYNIAGLASDNVEIASKFFEVIFASLQGDSLAVDLVPYGENVVESLGTILVNMQLAVEIPEEYESYEEINDFLEDVSDLDRANNLSEIVWGYDSKDGSRICKFSRSDGTCFKGKNCKLEHIVVKDGYTTDKIPAFSIAKNDHMLLTRDDIYQVLVTAYVDFCTYYVQIIQNPVRNEKCVIIDKDLSDLICAMNNKKVKYQEIELCPHVGELVVGYYNNFYLWLRARVIDLNRKDNKVSFKLYSVDFGVQFFVDINYIRQIKEEFIDLPFQALRVHLYDYQNNNNCDINKGKEFFQKHITFKNFLSRFKSSKAPLLVTITTFKSNDIGPTLLKEGLVVKRSEPLINLDERNQGLLDLE